jgi:hypothetical protein
MPLLMCMLYLAGHAALYLVALRDWPALDSEKGIFLYHFASAICVTAIFGIWALAGEPDAWTWFAAVVFLHGVYSLSFLELWALADDSFSLAILRAIDRSGVTSREALREQLETIAARKRASRLDDLERVGLLRETGDGAVALTGAGRAWVLLGRSLLFLVNVRKYG